MVNTQTKIQKYFTDLELPLPEEKERLDVWWNKVFKTNRYRVLSSLALPQHFLETDGGIVIQHDE